MGWNDHVDLEFEEDEQAYYDSLQEQYEQELKLERMRDEQDIRQEKTEI